MQSDLSLIILKVHSCLQYVSNLYITVCSLPDLQDCCATSGEGLFEGLGWVKSQLSGTKQVKMSAIQQDEEEPLKKRNRRQPSWLSFSNYLTHSNSANGTEACQLL
jgi:hypothetical protein